MSNFIVRWLNNLIDRRVVALTTSLNTQESVYVLSSGKCIPDANKDTIVFDNTFDLEPAIVSGFLSADLGESDRISVVVLAALPGDPLRVVIRATLRFGDDSTLYIAPMVVLGQYKVIASTVSGRMKPMSFAFYRQGV